MSCFPNFVTKHALSVWGRGKERERERERERTRIFVAEEWIVVSTPSLYGKHAVAGRGGFWDEAEREKTEILTSAWILGFRKKQLEMSNSHEYRFGIPELCSPRLLVAWTALSTPVVPPVKAGGRSRINIHRETSHSVSTADRMGFSRQLLSVLS